MNSIIFVSDLFLEDLIGGAELSTEALIESVPLKFKFKRLRSREVSLSTLENYKNCYWIFTNWSQLDPNLVPSIIANLAYSVIEYDYKLCRYRSYARHLAATGRDCDCVSEPWGTLVGAFYRGARSLWWMSEKQQATYHAAYPFLRDQKQFVLSSVFSEGFWLELAKIRSSAQETSRKGWVVLGSESWIKGTARAIEWCKETSRDYEVVSNLSPSDFLEKLSHSEGLVYLPLGGDTCPRMVIEAKLLGCQLHLNENVEHAVEDWFSTDDSLLTESYLYQARESFWNGIKQDIEWVPTISGYTTTRNCISQEYPWEKTVRSLLGFCDEVVVADGGSSDGTWESLQRLAADEPRLIIDRVEWDWSDERHGLFDGRLKAHARSLCTREFCWQMDSDEELLPDDQGRVKDLAARLPAEVDLVSLPVIDLWGSLTKCRIDVTPWKWRLSRNRPHITHGVPVHMRMHDDKGRMHASPGTDGCDYIDVESGHLIPHVTFYNEQAHRMRLAGLAGDKSSLDDYVKWFKAVIGALPTVRHYSWLDIERKIKTYRDYWQHHWESLYNIRQEDTPELNMFFDKRWSEVTDSEIAELAKRLASETGGHVFHTKIDWSNPTPAFTV